VVPRHDPGRGVRLDPCTAMCGYTPSFTKQSWRMRSVEVVQAEKLGNLRLPLPRLLWPVALESAGKDTCLSVSGCALFLAGAAPALVVETYTPLRDLRPCTWLPGCDLPVSVDAGCQHLYVDPYLLASSQTKMSGPDLAAPIERRFCTDSSVQYEDAGTCVPIRSFQLQTVVAVRGSQHCCAVAAVTHLSAAQRRSHACASAVACCVTHVTTLASGTHFPVWYCVVCGVRDCTPCS
jgi:hypothetical protein